MSGNVSPRIVRDGLVLYLDAANTRSFQVGSTTCNDLSLSRLSGSLLNGATFSSLNVGSLIFDGIDDYVDNIGSLSTFSFIQNTNIFSVNIWFKLGTLNTDQLIMGSSLSTFEKGFNLTYRSPSSSLTYGISSIDVDVYNGTGGQMVSFGGTDDNTITTTGWYNICYTINNTQTGQMYINGVAVNTTIKGLSSGVITNIKSSGNSMRTLNVGRANYSSTILPFYGNISNVQIYNKVLSSVEVTQNFNSFKSRYGY